jgi:hypothetical protein
MNNFLILHEKKWSITLYYIPNYLFKYLVNNEELFQVSVLKTKTAEELNQRVT